MVPSVESQSNGRSCVERLRAPQPILIYGRKDRAHVIDPDVASSRSRALTSSASTCGRLTLGRQLCRCPKKSVLNCMFHNVKVITRAGPYAANESEAGRWRALAEGEGASAAPARATSRSWFDSFGPIRAIKPKGITCADTMGLCRGRSCGSARPFR
jgi:hypothetical protein